MLLMPASKHDFSALAASTADAFFKGVPLEDAVVEAARRASLNPEEVRRLVERANTAVSVRLLRSDGHRKAAFALACSGKVLARTHPADPEPAAPPVYRGFSASVGQPSAKAASLVDLFDLRPEAAKTASRTARPDRPLREVHRLRRRLEEARQKKVATELALQKDVDRLVAAFPGRDTTDFLKFAAESLAVCGENARPVLKAMAAGLRVPAVFEKAAGIVDDRQPRLRMMSDICDGLNLLMKSAEDIACLRRELDAAWRNALHREENAC